MPIDVVESPLYFQHRAVAPHSDLILMYDLPIGQMAVIVEGPDHIGSVVIGFSGSYVTSTSRYSGYAFDIASGHYFSNSYTSNYKVRPLKPSDAITFVAR